MEAATLKLQAKEAEAEARLQEMAGRLMAVQKELEDSQVSHFVKVKILHTFLQNRCSGTL